jgi:hypothetical protein
MPHAFDPSAYPPAIAALLADDRVAPLDPGRPNPAARPKLAALTAETALAPHAVADADMARACLAGLWLYHDFLDESHTISQDIATPSGSYWHGIMHRREPDPSNSKYWFHRVGAHAIFPALHEAAAALAAEAKHTLAASLIDGAEWDPFAFVDLCERARGRGDMLEEFCRKVQRAEWELLFDHCHRRAAAPVTSPG